MIDVYPQTLMVQIKGKCIMKRETGDKENLLQQPEDTSMSDSWLLNQLTHQQQKSGKQQSENNC